MLERGVKLPSSRKFPADLKERVIKKIWVLVADEVNARILEKTAEGLLTEVAKIGSSKPGAGDEGMDMPRRRSRAIRDLVPTSADIERHHNAQVHAEKVALKLEEYRDEGRFNELHVVATARTFGYLRPEMAPAVKSTIVRMLEQDLIDETDEGLAQRLFETSAMPASS